MSIFFMPITELVNNRARDTKHVHFANGQPPLAFNLLCCILNGFFKGIIFFLLVSKLFKNIVGVSAVSVTKFGHEIIFKYVCFLL